MKPNRTLTYILIINIATLLIFALATAAVANYLKRDLERTQWVIVPEAPAAPAQPEQPPPYDA